MFVGNADDNVSAASNASAFQAQNLPSGDIAKALGILALLTP